LKHEDSERQTNVPAAPGVYLMKDRERKIIYVGKAGNLKNRLKAYTSGTDSRFMVPFLMSRTHGVDFIVTKTEKEALILENSLIKEHRPRYNVNLRDDKTYISIRINPDERFPRFQQVRRLKRDGARYFGPYPSGVSAKETLHFLQHIFPLRTCRDQELNTRKRPCLEYEIKRCLAPCIGMIDEASYRRMVEDSMVFLEGREKKLIGDLRTRMRDASEKMLFEEAAVLRDRIAAIEETVEKQGVVSIDTKDRDAFGLYRERDLIRVCILYVRKGRVLDKKVFPLFRSVADESEILSSFVKQYYDGSAYIPDNVILPCAIDDQKIVSDWLSEKRGGKVSVSVPKRGRVLEILSLARDNAINAFDTEKADYHADTPHILAGVLNLKNQPNRIECFDISNIGGRHAVGSMVTFIDGKPWKQGYRRFRIRTVEGADDYAMMYEVLKRRYKNGENLPDLVIVDGGKGQLGVASSVIQDLGLKGIDIVGMAKAKKMAGEKHMEDRVYLPGRKNPVYLSKWPAAMFLLQRIRDEAHRFAVSYYRSLKWKEDLRSVLDDIPEIGPARKKALLSFFGDLQGIKAASLESIQNVKGIGRKRAQNIINYLGKSDLEKGV
jgi:excinuclease ABC subunit C